MHHNTPFRILKSKIFVGRGHSALPRPRPYTEGITLPFPHPSAPTTSDYFGRPWMKTRPYTPSCTTPKKWHFTQTVPGRQRETSCGSSRKQIAGSDCIQR